MKREGLIAGVDAGATKTCVCIVDPRTRRCERVVGSGANAAVDGPGPAAAKLVSLIAPLTRGRALDAVVIGIAGAWARRLRSRLKRDITNALNVERIAVMNDAVAVLAALSPGENSLLLSVGTGAVLAGSSVAGGITRVDGWGPLAGDEGSAVWIGRRALAEALAIHDGRNRRRDATFVRAILGHFHLARPEENIYRIYSGGVTASAIAAAAPAVLALARRGSGTARAILREASRLLARTVRAGLKRMPRGRARLFVSGGLAAHAPEILADVRSLARRNAGRLKLERRNVVPAVACLRLAARLAGGDALERSLSGVFSRLERAGTGGPSRASSKLPETERADPASSLFSTLPALEQVRLMNAQDAKVAAAIRPVLPRVAQAVLLAARTLERGGRLIYAGAGTSGRLGILDASEARPTFGVRSGTVRGIIAGGRRAVTESVEGAEDRAREGTAAIRALRVNFRDTVVGLSASGTAPFVLACLKEAKRRRAATIGITCNPGSRLSRVARVSLAPRTGPEVVTGSTRLKAGTAQKMLLNMISTCAFARTGAVRGNVMARMVPGNAKLRARAVRIVAHLKGIAAPDARALLVRLGWDLTRAASSVIAALRALPRAGT